MRWSWFYNLKEISKIADGIGPDLDFIFYERIDDILLENGKEYKKRRNL